MALDSRLSNIREILSNAIREVDKLRSKTKHPHKHNTRDSSRPDRRTTGDSQPSEDDIEALNSSLRKISELINTPDRGGFSRPAVDPGELSGGHDAAAVEQHAANGASGLPAERTSGAFPALRRDQMGRELIRSLKALCDSTNAVRGKIKCDGVPRVDLGSLRLRIQEPQRDEGVVFAVRYAKSRDTVTLLRADVRHFHCPISSGSIQRPTDENIKQFIDSILAVPPAASLAYYVGEGLTEEFDGILETDDELRRLREAGTVLKGVNTTYWLLGAAGSGTGAHTEDMNLRSCNITIEGYKWWIVIDVGSTNAFEEWARSLDWPGIKPEQDDQWVRRMNLIPKKSMLVERGIGFSEYVTGPGEMITTAPRQYHWVINVTDSLSLAINFAFDGELQQGLESLESLPLTKNSPMWTLRQNRDPASGEIVSHGGANAWTPINQDVANSGPSDHDRGRPPGKAARAVAADAYYGPPPPKRKRRANGRGDGNTSSGRHRQQEKVMSNTSHGLLPQTSPVDVDSPVDVRWNDLEGLPRDDEDVFTVLLTLRGSCAARNCFGMLQAWRYDDCHPRRLISDYLSSKNTPHQPNGCIGILAAKSSHQSLLDRLLNSWAQLQVFRILYAAFGTTFRFEHYHRVKIPTLLGACDSPDIFAKVRSWYNSGLQLDQISPGTLEGLAIHTLLPHNTSNIDAASKGTLERIKLEPQISRLQTLYREHDYTCRLIRHTTKLIANVVSNTQIAQPQVPDDVVQRFQESLDAVDRDAVLKLLDLDEAVNVVDRDADLRLLDPSMLNEGRARRGT